MHLIRRRRLHEDLEAAEYFARDGHGAYWTVLRSRARPYATAAEAAAALEVLKSHTVAPNLYSFTFEETRP